MRQLVRFGARDVHVHAEHRRGVDERRRHVVAVADVRDRPPAQRPEPEPLAKREEVGDGLARMFFVGERVHHVQAPRRGGEFLEHLLRERPDDDPVDPSLQITGHVGDRLAASERHVGLQRHDVAAELAHRDLERRSRSQRRLVEEQRDVPPVERVGGRRMAAERAIGLHLRRERQAVLEIGGVEIED